MLKKKLAILYMIAEEILEYTLVHLPHISSVFALRSRGQKA